MLIPVSVFKCFAKSVNATRPHSVKGPTGSSCNTTPVLSFDRTNPPQARHWRRVRTVAPAVLEHAHQPRTCQRRVETSIRLEGPATSHGDCTHCPCSTPCHGTSPHGVPETLCEAVRLARNLYRGRVLVVGDMVHQRLSSWSHPWPRVSVCRTMPIANQPTPPRISHIATRGLLGSSASQALDVCIVFRLLLFAQLLALLLKQINN